MPNKKFRPLKSDSQCRMILNLWSHGRKITIASALKFGCHHLSQRLDELKKRGHQFFGIWSEKLGCCEYSQSPIMRKLSIMIEDKINA